MKLGKIFALILVCTFFYSGDVCMAENYKVLQCNDAANRCIVRNHILKKGLFTKDGKQILPCVYSDIEETEYSNYLITTNDHKMGLVNKDGNFLLKPEYLFIKDSQVKGKYMLQPDWDEKFGLADKKTGHVDIPAEYELIFPMANGAYRVEQNDKSGIINSDFKLIVPVEYYFIMLFPGNEYYRLQKEVAGKDLYGICDKKGKMILPVEYDWIDKNLTSNKQTVRKGNKTLFFNLKTGAISSK